MTRLFVALHIPDFIKEKILQYRNEAAGGIDLKWERKEKLHLTLKFIGNTDDSIVNKIADELLFIKNYPQINLSFTKFGFFFKRRDPKILWIGFSENEILSKLVDDIENSLANFGVPKEERSFKPHLTLLRVNRKIEQSFIDNFQNYKLSAISFKAEKISLIKSELLKEGSRYTEIKNYFLKGMEEE